MSTDNVINANRAPLAAETFSATAATATPQTFLSALSPAALYSQAFQPLYNSVDPTQSYPSTLSPYATPAFLKADPSVFMNTLSSASTGIQSQLDTLGKQAGSALQDANNLIANNPNGLSPEQYQQLMQDYQNYQLLEQLQMTIQNILASLKKMAIENMKLQG